MSQKSSNSNRTRNIIIGIIILGIIGIAVTFPLWRPIFVDDVVDEAFPTGFADLSEAQQAELQAMMDEDKDMAMAVAGAMVEDDTEMDEAMPPMPEDTASGEPIALSSGEFGEFDPVHSGAGTATIFELPDGSNVLRFEDFRVTNGPQLHVLLTANEPDDIRERPDDGYIDLGPLKGNVGNQNYVIPDGVNPDDFGYVVIYCVPFHVNFSYASLAAQDA